MAPGEMPGERKYCPGDAEGVAFQALKNGFGKISQV